MRALITCGAGFIGCNLAARLLREGWTVAVLDNLSRASSRNNMDWLHQQGDIELFEVDVRDSAEVERVFKEFQCTVVVHAAAQVAVTNSVLDPRDDFMTNALGTLNVLEAARTSKLQPTFIFSSTNKVYGGLESEEVRLEGDRYVLPNWPNGIDENFPLDFHSPYGCSKGCADQYVRDYARIYGLRTVCFRQSCIYGPRQVGVEDQGWVAWFAIAAVLGKPVTIYGDGRQVRDILYIDDLIDAYLAAIERIDAVSGQIYNIGGGTANALSILEIFSELNALSGREEKPSFDKWRPGDQKVFICNNFKAERELGWSPGISARQGVRKLHKWVVGERERLERILEL